MHLRTLLARPLFRWMFGLAIAGALSSIFVTTAFSMNSRLASDATAPEQEALSASAGAYTPDEMLVVLGFSVEITGAGSGSDVDSAWETASGGSLNIEIADSSTGSDQSHMTTPGHKYVDTLTLRGPLTAGRKTVPGCDKGSGNGAGVQRRCGGVNESSYEVLENGAGKFKIDIQGASVASANVESITMEDLVIDEREMTTGADWDYRVYEPGDAHFGSITIRSRVGKDSKELYQWWLDTSRGKNIRKS
ncbi:MAG: hypothetical protein FJ317_07465, partial [SAR202 cluster bacterium]|nr:hypothetical protein [SAR202 cluster bacterium]